MKVNLNTPDGFRDLIFDEAQLCREICGKLGNLYKKNGFRPIMTPVVEYYDVFTADSSISQQSMFKLSDNNGMLLAVRADNTIPMLRVAQTKLKGEVRPLKLCYNQAVQRISHSFSGNSSENVQSGVEIIGQGGIRSDLLCLSTALDAIACIADGCKLEIGNAEFVNALARAEITDGNDRKSILKSVQEKNLGVLSEYEKLSGIPLLYGGEEVFAKARELAQGNSGALQALDYTEKLFGLLSQAGYGDRLMVDMGIVHEEVDYYTGVVFRGYMPSAGEPILSGGRYDVLSEKFGHSECATGFAINASIVVKTLMRTGAYKAENTVPRYLIVYDEECYTQAESFKSDYDKHGIECEYSLFDNEEQSVEYAVQKGIKGIVRITSDGVVIKERS